jgi:DNA-binding XRE family transcriptional regulator
MNRVSSFQTPSGDTMVVLPQSDYQAMLDALEMAKDVAAYDGFKASALCGDEELVPSAVVERLLAGENPVRVWREYRGMTARDLAASCSIGTPYLSEIENGRKEGSVQTLRKLAEKLAVTIEDLL